MKRFLACVAIAACALVTSGATVKVSTHDAVNADGSRHSGYPLDGSASVLAWDTACLDTALAPIASQSIAITTSIPIDTASGCLTGTHATISTLSFVQAADGITACAGQWTIAGASPNRALTDTGPSAGAGSCKLKATYQALSVLSAAYPWNYTGAPADSLAPPIPTDIKVTNNAASVTLSGDVPWDACGVSTCKGAQDVQLQKDGSGTLATISVGTGFACNPILTNIGAMSTTPTNTQTGVDYATTGAGTVNGTADSYAFVNCAFSGAGYSVMLVNSISGPAGAYNGACLDRREDQSTQGAVRISACSVLDPTDGLTYFTVNGRPTTNGTSQALSSYVALPLPACIKMAWDSGNLHTISTSSVTGGKCNNDFTNKLSGYSLILPTPSYVGFLVTSNTAGNGVAASASIKQFNINNLSRWNYADTTTGSHTYAARARDQVPNTSAYSPTVTGTPTGTGNPGAIKFQPGWYAYSNNTCQPFKTGCDSSEIVSLINTEICPNANLVGLKLALLPAYLIPDSAEQGDYTGHSSQGFTAIDAVLAALRACSKYLMIEGTYGPFGGYGQPNTVIPSFTYSSSGCGLYTCAGGTAEPGTYGVEVNTQNSQAGFIVRMWRNEWRDLAIAAITAYCNRYDSNPSFYSMGLIFYGTSLPLAYPYPDGMTFDGFLSQYRTYLAAARAACPTTNIIALLDFTDTTAQMSTMVDYMKTIHGSITQNDVIAAGIQGQNTYTGQTGSTDYRGVSRYFESVEAGNMCGNWQGNVPPATIFGYMQNGNANQRPRWPNHITIMMAGECDYAGTGWVAWKAFIASINGQVMDGRGPTLRSPEVVKMTGCESSMTCP